MDPPTCSLPTETGTRCDKRCCGRAFCVLNYIPVLCCMLTLLLCRYIRAFMSAACMDWWAKPRSLSTMGNSLSAPLTKMAIFLCTGLPTVITWMSSRSALALLVFLLPPLEHQCDISFALFLSIFCPVAKMCSTSFSRLVPNFLRCYRQPTWQGRTNSATLGIDPRLCPLCIHSAGWRSRY